MKTCTSLEEVKVGIIGIGGMGNLHFRNVRQIPHARVVAICDVDLAKAEAEAISSGSRPYREWRTMIETEKLDAVLVCIPQAARGDEVQAAASRGLGVFVEKPAAANIALGEANACMIQQKGVINAIGYMWRSSSCLRKLVSLLQGREVGVVQGTTVSHAPPGSWFYDRIQSGGQVVDQTTHILNVGQALSGPALAVFATGTQQRLLMENWVKCEDVSSLSVKYRNGSVGSFSNCWAYHGHIFQIAFYGRDFAVIFDLKNNRLTGEVDGIDIEYHGPENPHLEEMQRFIDAVRFHDQKRIAAPYADGVETLKLTLAANRSLESGREEIV